MAGEPETTLDGTLERISFKNDENGFTIARFQPAQAKLPITIVGQFVEIPEGTPLKLRGQWVEDKKWGRQFKFTSYEQSFPKTPYAIEKYLGGGFIDGIGPAYAKRIVATFGAETLDVIKNAPHRLVEVPGIGTARAKQIASAIAAQSHVEDVMVFLARAQGVSPAFAARIVKRYGKDAIAIVKANPYRLASDIWGIGFRSADAIAQKLGIARDAPERVEAGILHALQTGNDDGHMHVPDAELIEATAQLLGINHDAITPRLGALELGARIIRETLGDRGPCTSLLDAYEAEQKGVDLARGAHRDAGAPDVARCSRSDSRVRSRDWRDARGAAAQSSGSSARRQSGRDHRWSRRRQDDDCQSDRAPRKAHASPRVARRADGSRSQAARRSHGPRSDNNSPLARVPAAGGRISARCGGAARGGSRRHRRGIDGRRALVQVTARRDPPGRAARACR